MPIPILLKCLDIHIHFYNNIQCEYYKLEIIKQLFIKENLAAPKFKGQGFIFLQSNNGEFHSKKVKLYSWASGIFQRFSSPHHSLMNGPVEHAIQKVKVVGKCMLEDRKMPQLFWQGAASMAIFVLNRTPNRYEGEWQREALFQMLKNFDRL